MTSARTTIFALTVALVLSTACGQRATPGAEVSTTPQAARAEVDGNAAAPTTPAAEATAPTLDGAVTRSPPPSMPLAQFLGRSRESVEGLLGTRAGSTDAGWFAYAESWALLYESACVVELRARVENGVECAEAAALLGFGDAGAPIRHTRSCEWPGISERHVLGPGLAGALDLDTGIFHARRVGTARRCDEPAPVVRR
jgi:hypothetical protein